MVNRHPTFYYEEPETFTIQLGDVLFRVHSFIIRRYFPVLNDSIMINENEPNSPDVPLVLEDVHIGERVIAKEVTPDAFELALRALYLEERLDNPPRTAAEWIAVLKLALRWDSPHLEKLAQRHISKLVLSLEERLDMAINCEQPTLLPNVYVDICMLRSSPSSNMLSIIPTHHLPHILLAREAARSHFGESAAAEWPCFRSITDNASCYPSKTERLIHILNSLSTTANPQSSQTIVAFLKSSLPPPKQACGLCADRYMSLDGGCRAIAQGVLVEAGVLPGASSS